eukprot:jgi/Tetstr1/428395/TSEL_001833.t1
MDEESRSRTVTNLIRTLSPKIGVQILPADVRVAGEGTTILDRQGRRCSTRLLGAPHLDDIERPVHQVWLRSPSFRGLTEADMWLRLAEGLLPAYDQSQPCEAAADRPAATPADVLALAGVRAWAEYEADTDADDAVICPPTRTLLALLEGRAVIQVTGEHSDDREDQPTTPLPGVLPPALSKQFFRCALTAKAICTGPLANLELPTPLPGVEMHHYHTEPTLLRVWDDDLCAISLRKEDEEFADTLRLAVALTSPVALLRAIRLRWIVIYLTESEFDPSELLIHPFSQTIREAGELGGNTGHNQIRRDAIGMRKKARKTAPASLALRATGRPIYTLTLQLTAHHHSIIGGTRSTDKTEQWRKTVSTAHSPAATATTGAHADDEEELDLKEEMDSAMEVDTTQGEAAETLVAAVISLDSHQRSTTPRTFREGTPNGTTERPAELQHLTAATKELLAQSSPASHPAIAAELASYAAETHQLLNPQRLSIQLERPPSQPTPAGKGKTATAVKLKKKQPRGRSRSDGATRNRNRSKPRLSGTRGSYSEWETHDDADQPSSNSHQ